MTGEGGLAFTLRRDRAVVLAALLVLSALAGVYTVWLATQMTGSPADMPGMDMRGGGLVGSAFMPWSAAHFVFMFSMWAVMMVGMMTPSAAPVALIYIQVARRSTPAAAFASAGWLVGGYLLAWVLFAAVATLAQWGLESLALISPMMTAANRRFAGGLLLAAGIYQWMPIKDACLSQCRAPLSFVQSHGGFQANASGSVRLGFLHGIYCIGCCWALMLLLFVGGVMNLLWIAALMIFVLAEKSVSRGRLLSRVAGLVAIALGIWMSTT